MCWRSPGPLPPSSSVGHFMNYTWPWVNPLAIQRTAHMSSGIALIETCNWPRQAHLLHSNV